MTHDLLEVEYHALVEGSKELICGL